MEIAIAGHTLTFFDCGEIVQGGPDACSLSVDGFPIKKWRFDPSPLEYRGAVVIPVRKSNFFTYGYALARLDLLTRRVTIVSTVRAYMKLLRVEEQSVVFATATHGTQTDSIMLA